MSLIKDPLGPVNHSCLPIKGRGKEKQEPIKTPLGGTLIQLCTSPADNIQPREQRCAHWCCVLLHLLLRGLSARPLWHHGRSAECCMFARQLLVVAYDDGQPPKENTALVEITVLQPSVIPVFTQEEYRYSTGTHTCPAHKHVSTCSLIHWVGDKQKKHLFCGSYCRAAIDLYDIKC